MKPYKPTKRELDNSILDLQKQIYELENKLSALTEHLGVYISHAPAIVKIEK